MGVPVTVAYGGRGRAKARGRQRKTLRSKHVVPWQSFNMAILVIPWPFTVCLRPLQTGRGFEDPALETEIMGASAQAAAVREFFTLLALCHTCIPEPCQKPQNKRPCPGGRDIMGPLSLPARDWPPCGGVGARQQPGCPGAMLPDVQ